MAKKVKTPDIVAPNSSRTVKNPKVDRLNYPIIGEPQEPKPARRKEIGDQK